MLGDLIGGLIGEAIAWLFGRAASVAVATAVQGPREDLLHRERRVSVGDRLGAIWVEAEVDRIPLRFRIRMFPFLRLRGAPAEPLAALRPRLVHRVAGGDIRTVDFDGSRLRVGFVRAGVTRPAATQRAVDLADALTRAYDDAESEAAGAALYRDDARAAVRARWFAAL